MKWLRRIGFLLHRDELAEELRVHQQLRSDAGEPARGFGSDLALRERAREVWGWLWLDALARDLRYALRLLRRSPGFAAVAVLSLGIGIGASTAVYSLAEAAFLRPLSVPNPGRLFTVYWSALRWRPGGSTDSTAQYRDAHGRLVQSVFSYPLWQRWRRDAAGVAAMAGFQHVSRLDAGLAGHAAESVPGIMVSGNFDRVVGIAPTLGRGINAADNIPGAPLVAELSYGYWQSHLGGARDVLGRTIVINGLPATIVGVGPRAFADLEPGYQPALYLPLAAAAGPLGDRVWSDSLTDATEWWVEMIGRLRPGATRAQAQAALGLDFTRAVAAMPKRARFGNEKPVFLLETAAHGIGINLHALAPMTELLGWLAGLVLSIAVVNLTNLLLARRAARRPELGLRMAIGAGRGAIARQLATEGLLLAALGGVAAVAVAAAMQRWLVRAFHLTFPVTLDGPVLGFTALVAVTVGLVLAFASAGRAPAALQPALNEAVAPAQGQRLHRVLLGVQVALCLAVLAGAGLFLRTLHNLQSVAVGFEPGHITLFTVAPGRDGYGVAARGAFYRALLARLSAVPGVAGAAAVSDPPATGGRHSTDAISLIPNARARGARTELETVSPGFLSTYRIRLLEGRPFSATDTAAAPLVAIVNREMAKRFDGDPLGRRLYWGKRTLTVVGVAADSAYWKVTAAGALPLVYTPLQQSLEDAMAMSFALRSRLGPAALAPALRAAVAAISPSVPVTRLETQREAMAATYIPQRILAITCATSGIVVLLLAAIGLYGLMAYALVRRTREIGIRVALGASGGSVARMLCGELAWVVGAGAAAGIALTLVAGQLLASLMFQLSPRDPAALASAAAFLILVAALAAALPARRAARLDPAVVLRQQ